MRVFTAVFYLLFFTLTAWGQTRRAEDQKVAKSHVCAVGFSLMGENSNIHINYQTTMVSSIGVSLK